jgi:hypothetical protein
MIPDDLKISVLINKEKSWPTRDRAAALYGRQQCRGTPERGSRDAGEWQVEVTEGRLCSPLQAGSSDVEVRAND